MGVSQPCACKSVSFFISSCVSQLTSNRFTSVRQEKYSPCTYLQGSLLISWLKLTKMLLSYPGGCVTLYFADVVWSVKLHQSIKQMPKDQLFVLLNLINLIIEHCIWMIIYNRDWLWKNSISLQFNIFCTDITEMKTFFANWKQLFRTAGTTIWTRDPIFSRRSHYYWPSP